MSLEKELGFIDRSAVRTVKQLNDIIEGLEVEWVCIGDKNNFGRIDHERLMELLTRNDLVHSGLRCGGSDAFRYVRLLAFNWNFLDPPSTTPCVSWKATDQFVAFNMALFDHLNGFVEGFRSINAALMEFAYRAIRWGGVSWFDPSFWMGPEMEEVPIPRYDEAFFVSLHFPSRQWLFRMYAGSCLRFYPPVDAAKIEPVEVDVTYRSRLLTASGTRVESYTAIIPTIDRYDYIGKSIESLLTSTRPPSQIIVVDQTPVSKRNVEFYAPYIRDGKVKVVWLDTAGQSTARNRAIREAAEPWILLFEDDAEAWKDMVEQHVRLIEGSTADVSTGISLAPWKDETYIPDSLRHHHIADILTTGNAFLRRDVALSVGGFDTAFDRGSGADDDFGRRLYLHGYRIVYNHRSIETHYKAPRGGMRTHGAWWRNKTTLFGPFPPPTQMFMIRKYYPPKFRPVLIFSLLLKAKRKYSWPAYILLWLLMPYKLLASLRQAENLKSSV